MLQFIREILVRIHTKFELSMCPVCPTVESNVCSAYLQNVSARFLKHPGFQNTGPAIARPVLKKNELTHFEGRHYTH